MIVREIFVDDYYEANGLEIKKGDRVLDLGGHIGIFAVKALLLGAGEIIVFEPHPENYEILTANIEPLAQLDLQVDLVQGMVTGQQQKKSKLWISTDNNTGGHSESPADGREAIIVPNFYFNELMTYFDRIDFLKMDIEGSEYEALYCLDDEQLGKIDKISMEWHVNPSKAKELINYLEDRGFEKVSFTGDEFRGRLQLRRVK